MSCGLTRSELKEFNWVTEEGRCEALCEDGSKCGDPYAKHAAGAWVRDLTREGVESNPGPCNGGTDAIGGKCPQNCAVFVPNEEKKNTCDYCMHHKACHTDVVGTVNAAPQSSPNMQTPQKQKEDEKTGNKSSSPTKPLHSTHPDHMNMEKFWKAIKHAKRTSHQVDIATEYMDDGQVSNGDDKDDDDDQPLVSTTVQVNADVLDIGDGNYLFGDEKLKLTKLLIRKHYVNLWDIILDEDQKDRSSWIITGTPGIGKSCFLAYVLHSLSLTQKPDEVIVWCSNVYQTSCIFHADGTVDVIDGGDRGMRYAYREGYLHDSSTWLLTDDVKPKPSPCKILLVSSPNTEIWKDFEKEYAVIRILPVWHPREIIIAHKTVYPDIDINHVLLTLSYVGGIPRRIFNIKSPNTWKPVNYLNEGLLKDIKNIKSYCNSIGQLCAVEKANHRLLHMHVRQDDPTYSEGYVLFASSYAAQLIARTLQEEIGKEIMHIVNGSEGAGKMGAWRGQLFEGMVHNILSKGGTFPIRSLDDISREEVIDIKVDGDVLVFTAIDQLNINKFNVFARPNVSNFESVDCIVTPNYLFQSTVGGHHDIKVHGVKLITQSLQKQFNQHQHQFKLIFVIPQDRLKDWKGPQKYITKTNTIATHTLDNVTQWVMPLWLSHTHSLSHKDYIPSPTKTSPSSNKRSRESSLSLPSSSPSPSPLPPSPSSPSSSDIYIPSKRHKQHLPSSHATGD